MSEDNSREERIKRNLKKFLSLESRNRLPQVNRPGPNKATCPRDISCQKKVQISGRSLMFACKILKLYAHINHLVTMNTNEKITFPSSRQNPASQFFHYSERRLYIMLRNRAFGVFNQQAFLTFSKKHNGPENSNDVSGQNSINR